MVTNPRNTILESEDLYEAFLRDVGEASISADHLLTNQELTGRRDTALLSLRSWCRRQLIVQARAISDHDMRADALRLLAKFADAIGCPAEESDMYLVNPWKLREFHRIAAAKSCKPAPRSWGRHSGNLRRDRTNSDRPAKTIKPVTPGRRSGRDRSRLPVVGAGAFTDNVVALFRSDFSVIAADQRDPRAARVPLIRYKERSRRSRAGNAPLDRAQLTTIKVAPKALKRSGSS